MSTSRWTANVDASARRVVTVLGMDAVGTLLGLYGALVLDLKDQDPAIISRAFIVAAPALVAIRLGCNVAGRLHRWSFRGTRLLDAARLYLACLVGSAAFALVIRGLPTSVYLLEAFLSANLMAAFRFAPAVTDEYDHERFSEVEAQFVWGERPRRVLNVAVALAGLVITLPLFVIISVAIKLTSRGPVIYKQERIGLDLRSAVPGPEDPRRRRDLGGRPFMMYKFRTMRVDAECATGAVWSGKDDPRVTPLGRFLRHCRLDELPQLLNVLKGDMNVVGPRPERASIFATLRERIPDYTIRQRARPGITGYAQVNLEYDATVEDVVDKLKYDAAYVREQSVALDLQIMAKTVPVMLFRDRMLTSKVRRVSSLARNNS